MPLPTTRFPRIYTIHTPLLLAYDNHSNVARESVVRTALGFTHHINRNRVSWSMNPGKQGSFSNL